MTVLDRAEVHVVEREVASQDRFEDRDVVPVQGGLVPTHRGRQLAALGVASVAVQDDSPNHARHSHQREQRQTHEQAVGHSDPRTRDVPHPDGHTTGAPLISVIRHHASASSGTVVGDLEEHARSVRPAGDRALKNH